MGTKEKPFLGEEPGGTERKERIWELFPRLKEEAPLSIFIHEYSCMCQTDEDRLPHQGDLFITTEHIAFYSSIIGSYKMVIPFADIRSISKTKTAWVLPNAITVTRFRGRVKDPKHYNFTNMFSRDETYRVLIAAWEEVKRKVIHEEGSQMIPILDPQTSKTGGEITEKSPSSGRLLRGPSSSSATVNPISKTLSGVCEHFVSLQKVICHEEVFDVDVMTFFKEFLSDESGFWLRFHASKPKEYSSVKLSPWAMASSGCCFVRDSQYSVRMNNTGGESAAIDQVQRCRLFDSDTLQFMFANSSQSISYGDCFIVESLWILKNVPDQPNRCHADFYVNLVWTKSTMFKNVLERASFDRTRAFLIQWSSEAKEKLLSGGKGREAGRGEGGREEGRGREIGMAGREGMGKGEEGEGGIKKGWGGVMWGGVAVVVMVLVGVCLGLQWELGAVGGELGGWERRNMVLEDHFLFLSSLFCKIFEGGEGGGEEEGCGKVPGVMDGGVFAQIMKLRGVIAELEGEVDRKERQLTTLQQEIRNSSVLFNFEKGMGGGGVGGDQLGEVGLLLFGAVFPLFCVFFGFYVLKKWVR